MKLGKTTRRIFIGFGALVAAGFLAAITGVFWFLRRECKRNYSVKDNPTPDDHFKKVVSTRFAPPDIYNLETVTVDSTSAVITWASAKRSRFEIESGDSAGPHWEEQSPNHYHMAELTGLEADTEHSFMLSEIGSSPSEQFRFRTLPDAGHALFMFATFSDNHFKPDGMSWPDGRHFRRCSDIHRCLVRDLNREAPEFLINKGDLTDSFEPFRFRSYREAVKLASPHSLDSFHTKIS